MKNLMLFVFLLFNVSVVPAQNCDLGYSDQIVDVFDNKIRIVQISGFSFGSGGACPQIEIYSIDVSQNQVIVQFYYNICAAWPQLGCVSVDTFFSNPLSVSSYELIIHTNIITCGYQYPDLDTLYDCDIDTLNFEILGLSENLFQNGKELYPNPANGLLTVNTGIPIDNIEIYNLSGVLVHKEKINAKSATLDVSALPPVHYLLRAIGKDEVWVEKFVVIR
ncbi:MAG: T9SS type A sorting domain-containing protein [Bacteroidales bacterium]|nr:T9SS type A sorting domain-containing protein [Bacteroidales bacterium]MCF8456655.1 T9SS type A sorting domain-containing protein [Bacteroidales bacterium]